MTSTASVAVPPTRPEGSFYATTRITQTTPEGAVLEFENSYDFFGIQEPFRAPDLKEHLFQLLEENYEETWERDDDGVVKLYGLDPHEFANGLVEFRDEWADPKGKYKTTWTLSVGESIDVDNWEHPCNL
tara:strand:+ start:687 stop:1076 length:390 start_codon:yes stop_codon:yes gene_type:complete